MDLLDITKLTDEARQVNKIYEIFNEDTRLNRSKAARVEFITTVKYIEKYLRSGARILDIGAGAGEYSLYFAEKGYNIEAVELAENNIKAFRKKITPDMPLNLREGNALDLSVFSDETFDVTLLMGPLYHLHSADDRKKAIEEAKRVTKKDGVIFFAFISHDMVPLTELCYNRDYFKGDSYDHETLRLVDFPFVFFTLDECRKMLSASGIKTLHEIASDGVSELLEDVINELDEESFSQYLKYHFYCCEKPEMLGRSNHLLFAGRK